MKSGVEQNSEEVQNFEMIITQLNNQMNFIDYKINELDSLSSVAKVSLIAKMNGNGIKKGKAVIFGFLGKNIAEDQGEDKFFTPLNNKYIGKANKDMYGVVVHANIISTILRGAYTNKMSVWLGNLIGLLITYLVFASFRPIYNDHKNWYDGLTKAMGIILSLIILFIIGILFAEFDYNVHFPAVYFGIILLAGDFLEIYYGLIKNVFIRIKKSL